DDSQAVEFGRLYRRTASDLNLVQTFVGGEVTERYLNDLVARAYLVIHGRARVDYLAPLRFVVHGYPAVFRRHLKHFGLAALLLFLGAAFGYVATRYDREVARNYLLPSEMPTIQPPREGEPDPTPLQTTGEFTAFSSHLF